MFNKHVLVAHRGGARLFHYDSQVGELRLERSFDFPLGKLQDKDLDADRPGATYTSFSSGQSTVGDERDSVDHQETLSAEDLAAALLKERDTYSKTGLLIVAGPHLLGKIRPLVEKHLTDFVSYLDKDLAKVPDTAVLGHIRESLEASAQVGPGDNERNARKHSEQRLKRF